MLENKENVGQKIDIAEVTSVNKTESPTIQNENLAVEIQKQPIPWYKTCSLRVRTIYKEILEEKEVIVTELKNENVADASAQTVAKSETINQRAEAEDLTEAEIELYDLLIQKKEAKRIAPMTFFQCLMLSLIAVTPVLDVFFLLFWALPWKYGNLSRMRMARAILLVKIFLTATFGMMMYQEIQEILEYYDSFFYEYNVPEYNIPEYNMPKYDSPREDNFHFSTESA